MILQLFVGNSRVYSIGGALSVVSSGTRVALHVQDVPRGSSERLPAPKRHLTHHLSVEKQRALRPFVIAA